MEGLASASQIQGCTWKQAQEGPVKQMPGISTKVHSSGKMPGSGSLRQGII